MRRGVLGGREVLSRSGGGNGGSIGWGSGGTPPQDAKRVGSVQLGGHLAGAPSPPELQVGRKGVGVGGKEAPAAFAHDFKPPPRRKPSDPPAPAATVIATPGLTWCFSPSLRCRAWSRLARLQICPAELTPPGGRSHSLPSPPPPRPSAI